MSAPLSNTSIQTQLDTLVNLNTSLKALCPNETNASKIANSILLKQDKRNGLSFEKKTTSGWVWFLRVITLGIAYGVEKLAFAKKRETDTEVDKAIKGIQAKIDQLTKDITKSTGHVEIENIGNKLDQIENLTKVVNEIAKKLGKKPISFQPDRLSRALFEATVLPKQSSSSTAPSSAKQKSTTSNMPSTTTPSSPSSIPHTPQLQEVIVEVQETVIPQSNEQNSQDHSVANLTSSHKAKQATLAVEANSPLTLSVDVVRVETLISENRTLFSKFKDLQEKIDDWSLSLHNQPSAEETKLTEQLVSSTIAQAQKRLRTISELQNNLKTYTSKLQSYVTDEFVLKNLTKNKIINIDNDNIRKIINSCNQAQQQISADYFENDQALSNAITTCRKLLSENCIDDSNLKEFVKKLLWNISRLAETQPAIFESQPEHLKEISTRLLSYETMQDIDWSQFSTIEQVADYSANQLKCFFELNDTIEEEVETAQPHTRIIAPATKDTQATEPAEASDKNTLTNLKTSLSAPIEATKSVTPTSLADIQQTSMSKDESTLKSDLKVYFDDKTPSETTTALAKKIATDLLELGEGLFAKVSTLYDSYNFEENKLRFNSLCQTILDEWYTNGKMPFQYNAAYGLFPQLAPARYDQITEELARLPEQDQNKARFQEEHAQLSSLLQNWSSSSEDQIKLKDRLKCQFNEFSKHLDKINSLTLSKEMLKQLDKPLDIITEDTEGKPILADVTSIEVDFEKMFEDPASQRAPELPKEPESPEVLKTAPKKEKPTFDQQKTAWNVLFEQVKALAETKEGNIKAALLNWVKTTEHDVKSAEDTDELPDLIKFEQFTSLTDDKLEEALGLKTEESSVAEIENAPPPELPLNSETIMKARSEPEETLAQPVPIVLPTVTPTEIPSNTQQEVAQTAQASTEFITATSEQLKKEISDISSPSAQLSTVVTTETHVVVPSTEPRVESAVVPGTEIPLEAPPVSDSLQKEATSAPVTLQSSAPQVLTTQPPTVTTTPSPAPSLALSSSSPEAPEAPIAPTPPPEDSSVDNVQKKQVSHSQQQVTLKPSTPPKSTSNLSTITSRKEFMIGTDAEIDAEIEEGALEELRAERAQEEERQKELQRLQAEQEKAQQLLAKKAQQKVDLEAFKTTLLSQKDSELITKITKEFDTQPNRVRARDYIDILLSEKVLEICTQIEKAKGDPGNLNVYQKALSDYLDSIIKSIKGNSGFKTEIWAKAISSRQSKVTSLEKEVKQLLSQHANYPKIKQLQVLFATIERQIKEAGNIDPSKDNKHHAKEISKIDAYDTTYVSLQSMRQAVQKEIEIIELAKSTLPTDKSNYENSLQEATNLYKRLPEQQKKTFNPRLEAIKIDPKNLPSNEVELGSIYKEKYSQLTSIKTDIAAALKEQAALHAKKAQEAQQQGSQKQNAPRDLLSEIRSAAGEVPKKQPRSTPNSLVRNIFDNKPNIYAELDQLAESNAKKITEVLTLMGSGNVKIKPNHQYAKAISEGLIRVLLKNNLLDKHHTDLLYKIMDEEEDKAKIFIDSRIQDVKQQITIDNIVKAQKKKASDDSADWEDE